MMEMCKGKSSRKREKDTFLSNKECPVESNSGKDPESKGTGYPSV